MSDTSTPDERAPLVGAEAATVAMIARIDAHAELRGEVEALVRDVFKAPESLPRLVWERCVEFLRPQDSDVAEWRPVRWAAVVARYEAP